MDDSTPRPDTPSLLADGALAAVVLVLAVTVVRLAELERSPSAILVGIAATLGFEIVASRNPTPVRDAWARRWVKVATVAVALLLGGVALSLRAGWLVVAGAAALATYLVALALVASGVLPPPSAWRP